MTPKAKSFIYKEAKKRIKDLLIITFMGLFAAFFEGLGIGLVFPLISIINDVEIVHKQSFLSFVYEALNFDNEKQFLLFLGGSIGVIFVIKNLYMILFNYVQITFLTVWKSDFNDRLMKSYLSIPYLAHIKRNSADSVQTMSGMVPAIVNNFAMGCIDFVVNVLTSIGIIFVLLLIQPTLTLCAGIVLFIFMYVQHRKFKKIQQNAGKISVASGKSRIKWIQQSLGSSKEIKVLGRYKYFVSMSSIYAKKYFAAEKMHIFVNTIPKFITEIVLMLVISVIIVIELGSDASPASALASLGVLAAAAFRMIPTFNKVLVALNQINHSSKFVEVIAEDFSCVENLTIKDTKERLPFKEAIDFKNISFCYAKGDSAIKDISFSIKQGEFIGIVGSSGAGKSTLADILLGLLPPNEGELLVDGVNIAGKEREWQNSIGYVPQDIYMMDDTLRRNIAFGVPDEDIDEDKLKEVIKQAQIDSFIEKNLPDGLDTMLGEKGIRFSGGQRQRIGIARALYNEPSVLILDEATSALDSHTEHLFSESVMKLKGEKTLIVIAHRLSTLKNSDRIIFLQDGTLADTGTMKKLTKRNKDFARLVKLSSLDVSENEKG